MFFLGAGFMLIETKAVVHMALLFGSTWMVNSIVFFAVLVMILLANLFVLAVKPVRVWPYYAALLVALAASALVPMDAFLGLSALVQMAGVVPAGVHADRVRGRRVRGGVRHGGGSGPRVWRERRRRDARRARASTARCCSASNTSCSWRWRSMRSRRSAAGRPPGDERRYDRERRRARRARGRRLTSAAAPRYVDCERAGRFQSAERDRVPPAIRHQLE